MQLDEMLKVCRESKAKDWNQIDPRGLGENRPTAVYSADVAIGIGTSETLVEDFKEEWSTHFPDKSAQSVYLDVFFNGSVVHREVCVFVDGARYLLPLPSRVEEGGEVSWVVDPDRAALARLAHQVIGGTSDFADGLSQAGIEIRAT
jgi:hypothetical protein